MTPDDEKPDELDGSWNYASLVDGTLEVGRLGGIGVGTWYEDDYETEEMMLILNGRLRLTEADGTVLELSPGSLSHIPKGWQGTWEILEDLRKVYVMLPE